MKTCRVHGSSACTPVHLNTWALGEEPGVGMTIYKPDHGLTIYQRRPFLEPEYYNGGCHGLYSTSNKARGPLVSQETKELFDAVLKEKDPFCVNDIPSTCMGIKGQSANSAYGWTPGKGGYKWMEIGHTGQPC